MKKRNNKKNSENKTRSMISFDWAIKNLLRDKTNFVVLEGFLSELLFCSVKIKNITESESNQKDKYDKYNCVDILVEIDNKELVIIELQFNSQNDYFQRMLYGASKAITDYMHVGDGYDRVRKVYSINIVHFDLGKGEDYIYRGTTRFIGLHKKDDLRLDEEQQQLYNKEFVGDLHPEYYILKLKNFDDVADDNTLDEWVYYLKNNKIRDDFTAQGLEQAREVLAYDNMSDAEKKDYEASIKARRIKDSEIQTALYKGKNEGRAEGLAEGKAEGLAEGIEKGLAEGIEKGLAEGIEKGLAEGKIEIAKNLLKSNIPINIIITSTGLTKEEIEKL